MTQRHSNQRSILTGILATYTMLSIIPIANAAIYKWVDTEGNTHYSDERPDNKKLKIRIIDFKTKTKQVRAKAEEIEETQSTEDNTVNSENDASLNDTSNNSQSAAGDTAEAKQKQANIDKAKQRRCEQARTDLAILSKEIPVYLNEDEQYRLNWAGDTYTGERNYLADTDKKMALDRTKTTISEYCHNPNDTEAQNLARKKWARSEHCLLNQEILKDLQRADIKASERQLNKQQALTEKYCNDINITLSMDEPELEIFPRLNR